MEHFYENIEGYFTFEGLYQDMVNKAKDGDHFVEVGVFKGRSAAFIAVCIANSEKKIKLDLVDHWRGDGDYEMCLETLKSVKDIVNLIKKDSDVASKLYDDESLDFVFIDTNHDYECVKNDIINWLPKVKKGGILAGHDYVEYYPDVKKCVDELLPTATILLNETCWLYKKE